LTSHGPIAILISAVGPPQTSSVRSILTLTVKRSNADSKKGDKMRHFRSVMCALLALFAVAAPAAAAPEGQMTWGVHISLAPTCFDPAETLGIITPFMVMYAMHDAMAKAMPGNVTAPSLAESWQVSPDGK